MDQLMQSTSFPFAFFGRRASRRLLTLSLVSLGAAAVAVTSVATRAQSPTTSAATTRPAATPSSAGATLAPSTTLGMGSEELQDASESLAQRFSTAAFDAVQSGENGKEPAAWR